ncbi:hypothetical protein SAMN05421858_2795 [Haladaptatus litoreus]|uniref:Uncharacterized protein n=1 Tax=Haladaptatus litoreus TaxID=553468 RepID=A0A1N7BW64_9EURY|nr:hypothetical protein [Haladaptatus litoreus]SIR55575.1 hypothetical protein SAMN05421858_2795 [Haladaptatus litoreus]
MVSVTRLSIDVSRSVDESDLTPAETGILNLLAEGRCTPAYVATELAVGANTARKTLDGLRELGLVSKPYRGLYELRLENPERADSSKYRTTETLLIDVPFEDDEFTPSERGVLNLLSEGRAIPAYLAQELGVTQECVKDRLRDLTRLGLVRKVHRGLYELDTNRRA